MAGRESNSVRDSLARLWRLMGPGQRRDLLVLISITVCGAFADVVTIGMVVPFLALLAAGNSAEHFQWVQPLLAALGAETAGRELLATTILLVLAALAAGIFRILLNRKIRNFTAAFGHGLSVELQRRMLFQPYAWHVRHNSSEQLAAIDKAEMVTSGVVLPLVQAAASAVLGLLIFAVLLTMAPMVTVAALLGLGVVYYLLGAVTRQRLKRHSKRLDHAYEERIRIVQEGVGGIRDAILNGTQNKLVDQFQSTDGQLARARADIAYLSTIPRFLIESLGIIVIAVLALVLSSREGGLVAALPVLGALALGAQRLLPVLQQLYSGWTNVLANGHIVDDVVRSLALPLPPSVPQVEPIAFREVIQFRDVSYAYADRTHAAVQGLSFAVRRGSRVALVGPTGSGKSTTADLLMGLLQPTSGEILVDGVPLTDANSQSWRVNVAHVPQMLFLADATIAENIAGSSAPEPDRVRAAAAMAQLASFIAALPDGLQTRVGERGVQLSGGQRQRLAIARAIYRETPLLVFDEATSALDPATEDAVLRAIDRLQQEGRTIVIIAHRPSTTRGCDQVLRLENGRLVEDSPARG